MDKGLTVPKWVLLVWPKIPPNAPEFICPIACLRQKDVDFNEKMFHWVSVVRALLPIAMPVQTHNSSL